MERVAQIKFPPDRLAYTKRRLAIRVDSSSAVSRSLGLQGFGCSASFCSGVCWVNFVSGWLGSDSDSDFRLVTSDSGVPTTGSVEISRFYALGWRLDPDDACDVTHVCQTTAVLCFYISLSIAALLLHLRSDTLSHWTITAGITCSFGLCFDYHINLISDGKYICITLCSGL